jgi:hypothetical protein
MRLAGLDRPTREALGGTMSERENQSGDAERAICHVCGREFDSQETLSKHLMDEHAEDVLEGGPEADRDEGR